jgi:hypothetical protein
MKENASARGVREFVAASAKDVERAAGSFAYVWTQGFEIKRLPTKKGARRARRVYEY